MLTDFQKECIKKVKDHWNLIPKTETGITRWQDLPNKVALIVDLFKQSKLSAEEFTKELKLTKGLINKFVKGKLPNGNNWPELKQALIPEKVKEEKENSPEEIKKKEILLKKNILEILNRDKIRDIGLRGETIKTELESLYASRFIVTILKRLIKEGKLESFLSEDGKYEKFRIKRINDPDYRKEKKKAILKLLEDTGLGTSRGLSPNEIRIAVSIGTMEFNRELLAELTNEGLIVSTGVTKGKKFVVSRLQKEAERILEEHYKLTQESREKKREQCAALENSSKVETTEIIDTEKSEEETKKISSLEKFLLEKSKKDVMEVILAFSSTSFKEILKELQERNALILIDAFMNLSLSDLQNYRGIQF